MVDECAVAMWVRFQSQNIDISSVVVQMQSELPNGVL